MIQAGLAALGQGRPPPTDLDGGREGRHHGPVKQNPRNQGLRTAHFSGDFLSVHCCHTSFVKPWAQPRHHTAHGKAQVVIASSSPAQPLPCPCRRSSAMSRPCPYPHGWRTGLGLLLCPLQRGSLATPRHLSSQRRSQRVQNQHHPGKSSPQTLVSAPWLHFLSTQCGCQSCPLPPTRWPQVKQSGQLRLRDHTAGMDGRGRGGQRSKAW